MKFQPAARPCPTRPGTYFKLALYYSPCICNSFQKPGAQALEQEGKPTRLPAGAACTRPNPPTPPPREPRSQRARRPRPERPRRPPPEPRARAPRRPRPRAPDAGPAPARARAAPPPPRAPAPPAPARAGARAALREGRLGARVSRRAPRGGGSGGGAFQKFPRPKAHTEKQAGRAPTPARRTAPLPAASAPLPHPRPLPAPCPGRRVRRGPPGRWRPAETQAAAAGRRPRRLRAGVIDRDGAAERRRRRSG